MGRLCAPLHVGPIEFTYSGCVRPCACITVANFSFSFRQWTYLAPERSWLNRRQKCGSEIWVTYVYNSALPAQFPNDCRHFLQTGPTAVSLWVLKSTTRSNVEAHDFSDRVRERGWGTQWTTNSSRCMTTPRKTPENVSEHTKIPSSKSALHHAGSSFHEQGKKTAPETTAEKRMPRTISGGLAGARGGTPK